MGDVDELVPGARRGHLRLVEHAAVEEGDGSGAVERDARGGLALAAEGAVLGERRDEGNVGRTLVAIERLQHAGARQVRNDLADHVRERRSRPGGHRGAQLGETLVVVALVDGLDEDARLQGVVPAHQIEQHLADEIAVRVPEGDDDAPVTVLGACAVPAADRGGGHRRGEGAQQIASGEHGRYDTAVGRRLGEVLRRSSPTQSRFRRSREPNFGSRRRREPI
jgi:hypothetical protein